MQPAVHIVRTTGYVCTNGNGTCSFEWNTLLVEWIQKGTYLRLPMWHFFILHLPDLKGFEHNNYTNAWNKGWCVLEESIFSKIRARHGIGTAHLLDGPSIKPIMHLWAQHRARHYIPLALGRSCWAPHEPSSLTLGPAKSPARARRPVRRGACGLELDIYT